MSLTWGFASIFEKYTIKTLKLKTPESSKRLAECNKDSLPLKKYVFYFQTKALSYFEVFSFFFL